MSTIITSRDRLIDILSLSYLGDLLREQLGDDAENYTWPDDFEQAVSNIDFKGLVTIGQASPYDTLICIGNGLAFLPRYQPNGAPNAFWNAVRFVANKTLTEIPARSFERQTLLQSVVIPDSVTSIGINAFQGCTGLQSVVIPDSVTSIGVGVFQGCTGLQSVRLPIAATYSGGSSAAFYGLNGLKTAGPEDSETDYAFKFATGVTSIGVSVFQGCTGLQSVVIPDSVTSIGINAFQGCTGLQSVVIPDSVTSIGGSAFYGCTGLQSVVADGVADLPNVGNNVGRFANCTALHTLSLKKCARILNSTGTASNNYGTFSKCTSLATVQLGSVGHPLTEISNTAFFGCTNTSLVMTVYTDALNLNTVLANIRNGATNATIIIKAAADMEYNGTTYQAGDTVLTSTP